MLRRVGSSLSAVDTPQAKLQACLGHLRENLQQMAAARRESATASNRDTVFLAVFFSGVVIFVSLLSWLLARKLRRSELIQLKTYHFPELTVQERLGASQGGGVVVETSWR